jgi:polyisoprenoid-binding protein YceI
MAWQLDTAHSAIEFTARHMMISKVRGRFDKFAGSVNINEQNPELTTVEVTIDAASINTREEARDGHLRSADFLNAEAYPSLTFKSTRVVRTGSSSAKLHGDLTIRDVTKPVVVDVEYVGQSLSPWGQTAYGFEGSTKINRKDWGLVWNVALETGGLLVSEEININLEVEVIKVAEAQPVVA